MKKWIRWQGLIAFVVVVAVIAVFALVFLDPLVKCAIEKYGSEAVGAKVELAKADLSLMPLGLTLTGLAVADRDAPMTNLLEARRIAFLMDGGAALMRKVEIKDMAVEDLAFGTPRKTSGALSAASRKAEERPESAGEPMLTFETPDVKNIIKDEELETLKAAKELETLLTEKEALWKQKLGSLPEQKNVTEYEARLKEATAGKVTLDNAKERAKKLEALSKDIRKDMDTIDSANKDLKADIKALKEKLAEVKAAPARDKDRIASKYSLTPEGLEHMSELLFKGRITEWSRKALRYYEISKPYIAQYKSNKKDAVKHVRGRGIDVKFKERNPRPDFIIQRAALSVRLDAGILKGQGRDLTAEQNITGRPSVLEFNSSALKGMRDLSFKATLDHIKPDKSIDRALLKASGVEIAGMNLSGGSMPVSISGATSDINAEGIIRTGGAIEATATMDFSSVKIDSSGKGTIAGALTSALKDVKSFKLTAHLTGTLEDHKLSIRSDLDSALKQAAGKAVAEETRKLKEKLDTEISSRTGGKIKELESRLAGFGSIEDKLDSSRKSLESVQKNSAGTSAPAKSQAEDKLKQKLKKLF